MPKSPKIRLHKYLRDHLRVHENFEYSVPEISRNIARYGVQVDGVFTDNRLAWVLPGQKITYSWPQRESGDLTQIKVLQETTDHLLLYKPPGVVVQPGAGHQRVNLVNWLLANYPEQAGFSAQDYPTRGLVHRLDKQTQGLLLVARTSEALQFFQDQFRARQVVKKYLAVVTGVWLEAVEIKNYQARSKAAPTKNKFFWNAQEALNYDLKARFAHSFFRPLFVSRESKNTLVEVQIMTGRMHQIRLQAQALNHALVGDPKYFAASKPLPASSSGGATFDSGWRGQPVEDITHINGLEFRQLQTSIFGSSEFCLLSNYLALKDFGGETLEFKYYD